MASAGPENSNLSPSHELVKESDVKTALSNDKGPSAAFKSFEIRDFTSKGDNYAAEVSSVIIKYEMDGVAASVTHVVKLNPCRDEMMEIMAKLTFEKEIGFYTKILPLLNSELIRIGQPKIRAPSCYHYVDTPTKQVIYLEDLREYGFKMADRMKGLDSKHLILLLKELARVHASSHLLFSRGEFQEFDQEVEFPALKEIMAGENSVLDTAGDLVELCSNYFDENDVDMKMNKFVAEYKGRAKDVMGDALKVSEKFKTICHGDCWTNNFLFRYSADGEVEECRLLDFQVGRIGSPAFDLNYLMFASTSRKQRKADLHEYFLEYYCQFASTLAAGGIPMKFSLEELKQEYKDKHAFGLLMGMMVIPATLVKKEDAFDFELAEGESMEQKIKDFIVGFKVCLKKSDQYAPRLLGMIEDIVESGFFDEYKGPKMN